MSKLTIAFKKISGEPILIATADIADGWKKLKNNFGYYGCANEEYHGDDVLTVRAWVNERPPQAAVPSSHFPLDLEGCDLSPSHALKYRLRAGRLEVGVCISTVMQSTTSSGKSGFDEDGILIGERGKLRYWLRFFAGYKEKNPKNPVSVEHDLLPFPSAGLPGLGKKR